MGALLWSGAANAQVACGTVMSAPRAEVSLTERGGAAAPIAVVPPGAVAADIKTEGERRVEIWSVPEAPGMGMGAGCGASLTAPAQGQRAVRRGATRSLRNMPSRDVD